MDENLEKLLGELEDFARENDRMWNVPRETGRLLHILTLTKNAKNVIEVGMSNGYSAIWIASALKKTGGKLTTLEADPWKVELALENFRKADLLDVITIIEGDAAQNIEKLQGPFDLAFIDAAKEQYLNYFKLLEPKLASGCLILADNAVSHREGMKDYLDYVCAHPGLESVLVPIGSGEMVSVKL